MGLLALLAVTECHASWLNLVNESFDISATNRWTYTGVTNASGQALFRLDPTSGVVQAEWNQTNLINGDYVVPPTAILNSRLTAPLGRRLTDRDTFRVRATVTLTPGTIPDTTEFWQLATFGLYDFAETGPDRALVAPAIKDTSDAVEFNYFIGNAWGGPSVSGLIASHLEGLDFQWTIGPSAAMGVDHWLSTGVPLYIEMTYHGAATGTVSRRLHVAVYADAAFTTLVQVNGTAMEEWTSALPAGQSFGVREVALVNYAAPTFGGVAGEGRGTYDDVLVEVEVPEASWAAGSLQPAGLVYQFAAEPGASYAVMASDDLAGGGWTTQSVLVAAGAFTGVTNVPGPAFRALRIEKMPNP